MAPRRATGRPLTAESGSRPGALAVQVLGAIEETDPGLDRDPRAGLDPLPGELLVLLLLTPPGVTLGTGITRRPHLLSAIRALPELGPIRLSPMPGTVGPGGEHWLAFQAAARLPLTEARPLDLLCHTVQRFLEQSLQAQGVELTQGRVEGAWCPGSSDLGLSGRKLCGLAIRLSAGLGLVRGVLAVSPPEAAELAALDACHRLFSGGLDPRRMVSLSEIPGLAGLNRAGAVALLGGTPAQPAKMKP